MSRVYSVNNEWYVDITYTKFKELVDLIHEKEQTFFNQYCMIYTGTQGEVVTYKITNMRQFAFIRIKYGI